MMKSLGTALATAISIVCFQACNASFQSPPLFTNQPTLQNSRRQRVLLFSSTAARSEQETPPKSSSPSLLDPQAVSQRVFRTDKRPIILFDGVCNLCNNAVNLALDWDPQGKLRFSALQSNVGQSLLQANGRTANDISSIVLVTESGAYIKSDAILKITEALTPWQSRLVPLKPLAVVSRWVVPRFLRDLVYDGVANNRYDLMGKRDQCRFDADGEFEDRFVDDTIALQD